MKPLLRCSCAFIALVFVLTVIPASGTLLAQDEGPRKVLSRVNPQYPNLARSMNIQGTVKADVLVAPNGTVKSVEIKGGHPLFGQSAQNALREWKWEPAARETHEIIELKFAL
jgi:periplasmic protein TonB